MILYRSLHNIDLPNRTINTKRTFPDDFSSFVSEFVSFTTQSENNKMYRVECGLENEIKELVMDIMQPYLLFIDSRME